MPRRNCAGFTLIELMVAIGLAAIVLALALPSFVEAIRSSRVTAAANEFVASVALARSEAIRSGRPGRMCASRDGASCAGEWSDGWLVWTDTNSDGLANADERPRRTDPLRDLDLTATAPGGGNPRSLVFDSRGRLRDGQRNFALKSSPCRSGALHQRNFELSLTGQLTMEKDKCP